MDQVKQFIQDTKNLSIAKKIFSEFEDKGEFSLTEVYPLFDNAETTVRARIYQNLDVMFEKVERGVYKCKTNNGSQALVIQGDGRDLSSIPDGSIDAIFTDHPYDFKENKSFKGSSRNFIAGFESECFAYNQEDFDEKARVLKKGSFLVEMMPEISGDNWKYIFHVMQLAENAGFHFYAQVPWKKGKNSINMGRKKRNKEMLYFFTKGSARKLRHCNRKTVNKMAGTRKLLPAEYDVAPIAPSKREHPVEKPIDLLMNVIHQITEVGEIVLDQFSGSFNTMLASLLSGRHAISIELQEKYVSQIVDSEN